MDKPNDRPDWWTSEYEQAALDGIADGIKSRITPGQAAYEKWTSTLRVDAIGNAEQLRMVLAMFGLIAPPWNMLDIQVCAAWEEIARAAIVASGDVQAAYERGLEDGGA